jgi:serine/threonine-protein kinase
VIEAYLDGDRDLEQRRRLADQSADVAAAALQRSRDTTADEAAIRALALRETMTALGLDPENARARGTLVRILTEPGRDTARLAEEAGHDDAVRGFRLAARNAIYALLTYLLYVPIVLWMGVRHWWMLGALAGSISGVIAMTWHYHRHPPPGLRLPLPHLAMTTIALASGVVLFGPLVVLPAVVIANGVAYIANFERRTWTIVAASIGVILVPLALELLGVLPAQYEFRDGTLRILPGMTDFPPAATLTLLIVTHVVVIGGALIYVGRLRRGAQDAERRLRTQAWQLAQIVPEHARELLSSQDS